MDDPHLVNLPIGQLPIWPFQTLLPLRQLFPLWTVSLRPIHCEPVRKLPPLENLELFRVGIWEISREDICRVGIVQVEIIWVGVVLGEFFVGRGVSGRRCLSGGRCLGTACSDFNPQNTLFTKLSHLQYSVCVTPSRVVHSIQCFIHQCQLF